MTQKELKQLKLGDYVYKAFVITNESGRVSLDVEKYEVKKINKQAGWVLTVYWMDSNEVFLSKKAALENETNELKELIAGIKKELDVVESELRRPKIEPVLVTSETISEEEDRIMNIGG